MFVVRPAAMADIPGIEALASGSTPAVHTLPRTTLSVQESVERSIAAFAAQPAQPNGERYLFVLADADGSVAGMASIAARAGADGTFFAFRNEVLHQASRDLGVSHSVHALTLSSDLTHCSQLSGFHLREPERVGGEAALLSRARLLFAASAPQRFAEKFFSAMAGVTDGAGRSPFWEALGRKFFNMDFLAAERMIEGARNRTVIVELMPHYPVYVPLLGEAARAVLGQVHPEGRLAQRALEDEGFAYEQYIDIFDGGAILQAHRRALRAFSYARRRRVADEDHAQGSRAPFLVTNLRNASFRAVIAQCAVDDDPDEVGLDDEVRRALDVVAGDAVLCLGL